jgi:hypothetical protein
MVTRSLPGNFVYFFIYVYCDICVVVLDLAKIRKGSQFQQQLQIWMRIRVDTKIQFLFVLDHPMT